MDSVPGQAEHHQATTLTPTPTLDTLAPELTASGKPKKRFVGKARRLQQEGGNIDPTTIEDSAIAIRDGKKHLAHLLMFLTCIL